MDSGPMQSRGTSRMSGGSPGPDLRQGRGVQEVMMPVQDRGTRRTCSLGFRPIRTDRSVKTLRRRLRPIRTPHKPITGAFCAFSFTESLFHPISLE